MTLLLLGLSIKSEVPPSVLVSWLQWLAGGMLPSTQHTPSLSISVYGGALMNLLASMTLIGVYIHRIGPIAHHVHVIS